ncbi:6-bladed beta-propeller [Gemmatimonadota bacterium]
MKPAHLLLTLALGTGLQACERDSSSWNGAVVRDSAGVEIVEIRASVPRSRFTLSEQPLLEIGGLSGDPASELYNVSGGVRFADGRIVIANAGTQELKVFDSAGHHVRTVGREGEGPGEFLGINWIGLHAADSILTYDRTQNRIQVFDRNLELGRVTVLQAPSDLGFGGLAAVCAFPDGSLLARGPELVLEYPRQALQRHVFRFSPEGIPVDSIGPFRGGREIWMSGEPWPPFERKAAFVVHGESFYTAASDLDEFRRISQDGDLERIVRGGHEPQPVTEEDIANALEGRPPMGIGEPWIAPTLPLWSEFVVDDEGAVWRRAYPRRGDERVLWTVVSGVGEMIAEVETPLNLRLLHVGSDFILAVRRDTLDVEYVVLLGLKRSDD